VLSPHADSTDCCTAPWLVASATHLHSRTTSMSFSPHSQSLHHADGGSMVLQNVGITPHHYMASKPRIPQPESSPP